MMWLLSQSGKALGSPKPKGVRFQMFLRESAIALREEMWRR